MDYKTDFTSEDIKAKIEERFQSLTEGKSPASHPHVVFMGGLPGSGKSRATKKLIKEYGDNIITVDLDDYRKHHPKASDIARIGRQPDMRVENPAFYSVQTGDFAW